MVRAPVEDQRADLSALERGENAIALARPVSGSLRRTCTVSSVTFQIRSVLPTVHDAASAPSWRSAQIV